MAEGKLSEAEMAKIAKSYSDGITMYAQHPYVYERPDADIGRLWYYPDGNMYVYYTPTHWSKP